MIRKESQISQNFTRKDPNTSLWDWKCFKDTNEIEKARMMWYAETSSCDLPVWLVILKEVTPVVFCERPIFDKVTNAPRMTIRHNKCKQTDPNTWPKNHAYKINVAVLSWSNEALTVPGLPVLFYITQYQITAKYDWHF